MTGFVKSMLLVMLCLVVLFSAFAIPYSENNFFDMVMTVEQGLGNTSSFIMDAFVAIKDFGSAFVRFCKSSWENVFGKWLDNIFERYDLLEKIEKFFDDVQYTFYWGSSKLEFYGRYGFKFTNQEWNNKLFVFEEQWRVYRETGTNMFINDYKIFNFDEFDKFYDGVFKGVENEYTYLRAEVVAYCDRLYDEANNRRVNLYFGREYYKYASDYMLDGYYGVTIADIGYTYEGLTGLVAGYPKESFYRGMITHYEYPVYSTNISYEAIPGEPLVPLSVRFVLSDVSSPDDTFSVFKYFDNYYNIQFKFHSDGRDFWVDSRKVIKKLWQSSFSDIYSLVYENALVCARAFYGNETPLP